LVQVWLKPRACLSKPDGLAARPFVDWPAARTPRRGMLRAEVVCALAIVAEAAGVAAVGHQQGATLPHAAGKFEGSLFESGREGFIFLKKVDLTGDADPVLTYVGAESARFAGGKLVLLGSDGHLHVVDVSKADFPHSDSTVFDGSGSGLVLHSLTVHNSHHHNSRKSLLALTSSDWRKEVRVWSVSQSAPEPLVSCGLPAMGYYHGSWRIESAVLSTDGSFALFEWEELLKRRNAGPWYPTNTLTMLKLQNLQNLQTRSGVGHAEWEREWEHVQAWAMSPDSKTLVTAHGTRVGAEFILWRMKHGRPFKVKTIPFQGRVVHWVTILLTGKMLVLSSRRIMEFSEEDDDRLDLYEVKGLSFVKLIKSGVAQPPGRSFRPISSGSGRFVLWEKPSESDTEYKVWSVEKQYEVWSVKEQRVKSTLTVHDHDELPVALSEDGRFLATSDWPADKKVSVWDLKLQS